MLEKHHNLEIGPCCRRDVKMHIDNCPISKDNILSSPWQEPSLAYIRTFLINHFAILAKNDKQLQTQNH